MNERIKNFLWLVIVLIAFGVISFLRGNSSMYLDFDNNAIIVAAPQNVSYSIPFEHVASIEVITEKFDPGTMVNGKENRNYIWGTWENEELGQYTLCISKKIDNALLITETDGDIFVLNYENEETTASLADMIPKLIESKLTS